MKRTLLFIAVCLLPILPTVASAQSTQDRGDALRVYLITLGPGADPWEKFGHDFIDIEDPNSELIDSLDPSKTIPYAVSYNWGVFNFGHGFSGIVSFGWHFVQGKLIYSMDGYPTRYVVDQYVKEGRYVLKQELNLTARQKLDLWARLQANDTDANRYYLYDYFLKNCSTMTRDAIDQTVDGRARDVLSKIPSGTTYRQQDRRCTADDLWLYLTLDYALGHAVDQPLSAWQESFLPEKLASHLRQVTVSGPGGKMVPLIESEEVLNAGTFPERNEPPNFFWGFLVTGIGFGALLCGLAWLGRKSRLARWAFNLLVMAWSLFAGFLGALLCFAWLTNHDAAKWNENWFQANVLSLALVVLIPASRRWPRAARGVALSVLGLALFDLLAKVTPWFYQVNGQIIAVVLPVHAAIAWGLLQSPRPKEPPAPLAEPTSEALRAA